MMVSNGGIPVNVKALKNNVDKGSLKGSPYAIINNPSLKKAKKILAVLTSI